MELGVMKRQSCGTIQNARSSSPPALGMHMESQMISKDKPPKIRIIHIFAPEIIKTDVANFRELVQRLTGKPTSETTTNTTKKKKPRIMRSADEQRSSTKKLEIRTGFRPSEIRERIKGEEEIWGGANSGGGFLGGFSDLDGFMQELTGFQLLPLDASHMDAFGETQLA